MPFPITVDADFEAVTLLETPANIPGPFQVGSNLYTVVWLSATGSVAMYKSTDAGSTWTNVGINIVFASALSSPPSAVVAGIEIVISTQGPVEVVNFHDTITRFNTLTDSWGASHVTANQAGTGGSILGYDSANTQLIVCSQVLAFVVTISGIDYERCGYYRYNLNTNTAGIWIPCGTVDPLSEKDASPIGLCSNIVGLVGMFFYAYPSQDDTQSAIVSYQPLNNSVLGILTTLDSEVNTKESNRSGGGKRNLAVQSDGTTVLLAWGFQLDALGLPDAPLRLYYGALTAFPAFTQTSLTITDRRMSVAPVVLSGGAIGVIVGSMVDPDIDLDSTFTSYLETAGTFSLSTVLGVFTSAFGGSPIINANGGDSTTVLLTLSGSAYFWNFTFGGLPPVTQINVVLMAMVGPIILPDPLSTCAGPMKVCRKGECCATHFISDSKMITYLGSTIP